MTLKFPVGCVLKPLILSYGKKKRDLFLKEINGFMLNVTDHYCISPATSKGGFPVIRVICHESVIYVTGHVGHRSEAQGVLPRITRQSETRSNVWTPKYYCNIIL